MKQSQLTNIFLDQSQKLIWIINLDFQLIYANKRYLSIVKTITGKEHKLYESAFVEGFGEASIEKWKAYYNRAIKGEYFEIEEHHFNPEANEIQYGQTILAPLTDDNDKIFAVACQSNDITRLVKHRSEANQLIDASLDVFCTINETGNFVYVSAASSSHWGYASEELIGKPYLNFVLEEDLATTNETEAAVLRGKDLKSFVNRYKKKNGGIAHNLWSVRWDDTAKLMYCVARDAKEIVEQEEQIQQSEQRFKALVQEGSDLIGILDAEGNYSYVSPTSTAILGIAPEEFIGRNALDFIHPDDVERTLASLQKIANENKVIVEPFRFQNHKKEWRWVETVLTNMLDNPVVNGIVANSRDITEQVEEQRRLKLLESVITNTKDAILITEAEPFDEPGPKIMYVNEAFTKMTGYEAAEVIGKTPRILQGPNSNKEELVKLGRSLRKWEPYEITTINYKKNGEEFWINFTVTPVSNEKGWYTHWIAIERDVTEQKAKELENNLVNKITTVFNESDTDDLKVCLTNMCKHISDFGDFDFAEIWLPTIDSKSINRIANHASTAAGKIFYGSNNDVKSFTIGEGMPGFVWKNKAKELWEMTDEQWSIFNRKVAANGAGMKTIIGIPLKNNHDVIGVLLLGSKKLKLESGLYAGLFQKLESIIGAELSRKKTEIELAQIFDFTPDVICVAGFDGFLQRINPAGLELLGYTLKEMRSRPIRTFVHEHDRSSTKEQQTRLYNGGNQRNFENRYVTKEGNIVWLSWSATSSPEQGIIYAVAKNITEEKNLRELNRQAGKLAKIGSWELDLIDQDGVTMYWSPMVKEMLGLDDSYQPSYAAGLELFIGESKDRLQQAMDLLIKKGVEFDVEVLALTAEGKEKWMRCIGKREMVNNRGAKIYGSFQDIDERKKAEINLSESENRMRTILEAEPECVKLLSSNGEILMMNPAGLAMIEAENEEQIKGKSVLGILLPEHRPAFLELTKNVFKGESGKLVFEIKGLKGTHRWLETHAVPMKNGQSEIISLLGVTRDITERKNAEENFRRSEEKNRLIMNAALDAIICIDVKGNVIFWNPQAEKTFGWRGSEVMGQKLSDYIIPEKLRSRHDDGMNRYLKTGEAKMLGKMLELSAINRKKEEFPIELTVVPIKQGKEEFFCAFIRDISQRKNAERSILLAKERFEKVTEATNDAIWDWDIVNGTFYRSKAIERIFGKYASKSLSDKDFWKDNFHPEDLDRIQNSIDQAIADPQCDRWEQEYRVFNVHGKIRYIIDRGVIVRNGDGKAVRMVGAMTDISEQKESDEKDRFKAKLLSTIGQAAISTNLDGVITYWNKAAEHLYGWKAKEAIGKNIMQLTPLHTNKEEAHQIMEVLKKGQVWSGEFEVRKKDGTNFFALISNSPIYDENKTLSGIIGISSDNTEKIKNQELIQQYTKELERSNEELEQFAFIASHDLQEPLRMVSSFMDQLTRKYGDQLDEKAHQYIHFATDGAKRMKQIILDLLAYSRASGAKEGKEEVDLNEILSEFKLLRRSIISEHSATITSNHLPTLYVPKAAITQIFHCFLDNALKYSNSETAPIIEVKNTENENEWEFSIKDNGIGIDPQFYNKIFVMFQRLHNKDDYAGTGIGLSIAKRHIEFLGGKIWLNSTPGEGTIFYFTIPKI